mmetsp:Transcript_43202/g.69375  ORF Transcript_43202/g.69375 Transcript_43202/m.69375 type:complete len:207 (+) Transcript_43202:1927-2547(+)
MQKLETGAHLDDLRRRTDELIVVEVQLHHVGQPGEAIEVLDLIVVESHNLQLPALLEPFNARDVVVAKVELAQAAHGTQTLDHLDLIKCQRQRLQLSHETQPFNLSELILRGIQLLQHNLPVEMLQFLECVAIQPQCAQLLIVAQRLLSDLPDAVHLKVEVLESSELVNFEDGRHFVARQFQLAQLVQRVQPPSRRNAIVREVQSA